MKDGFIWGTSTASYQIEGAWNEDGKVPSIYDTYTHAGRAFRGQNADVSCDHYHRYKEDVALMAELGVQSYRFSVAWPRVIKNSKGEVNEKGLQFYSDLIDELLAHSIEPFVTLYHWDMPQFIFDRGGLLNRETVDDFAHYTRVCAECFKGRVKRFITVNEAQNVLAGLAAPHKAPGNRLTSKELNQATHHLLLYHGVATKVLREVIPDAKVSFSVCGWVPCPVERTEANIKVCYDRYFELGNEHIIDVPGGMCDAVFLGDYPREFYEKFKDELPDIKPGDMELISQPLDFLSPNLYSGYLLNDKGEVIPFPDGNPQNFMYWDDIPECMYWGLKFLYERYKLPMVVAENGWASNDRICLDGKVHDSYRIDMVTRYLMEMKRAMDDGVPVDGYFHWSMMDNFEWGEGYFPRLGLVYVDYATGERTRKDSFYFYKDVVATNGKSILKSY